MNSYSEIFNSQKIGTGYMPTETMKMINAEDNSFFIADSSSVYPPNKDNGQYKNNILYSSLKPNNYRWACHDIYLYNDLYDVNDYNNKITFTIGATTTNMTLTNGRYKMKSPNTDPLSFAKMFNDVLTTNGLGAFVVNVTNGILTLTKPVPVLTYTISYPDVVTSIYATRLHGLNPGTYGLSIQTTPEFCYTKEIYFVSDVNRYSVQDETSAIGQSNIIEAIQLDRDLYSTDTNSQKYNPMSLKYFKTNETMSAGTFTINIVDDNGQPLFIHPESKFRYIIKFLIKNIMS